MLCLQYSKKLNGGNQVLTAVYNEINDMEEKSFIYLTNSPLQSLITIFFKNRNTPILVSDPFCSFLLFLSFRSKVVHFVQSDDINLFKRYGFLFNIIYKNFYKIMMCNKKWYRIFNSNYSQECFSEHFKLDIHKSYIVPILGIKALFPTNLVNRYNVKNKNNFIWIGSKHTFKGGKTFIKAINKTESIGHMIFNGDVPKWAINKKNIYVDSNLKRMDILNIIRNYSALVYTSEFDSFAMPIFEALLVGCDVIAIQNKSIELNHTNNYIFCVSSAEELCSTMSNFCGNKKKLKQKINWELEHKKLVKWRTKIKFEIRNI